MAGEEQAPLAMDGDQHTHNGLGVGALLRASRLRVGEELRDVAYMLRIRYPYLEAIEDGRYEELPGPTYAIGFIRAYAEHLGLDSEEVIRRFKSETADVESRPELAFPVPISESSVPGGAIVFIGVVVAVLAYAGWYISTTRDGFFAELISPPPERLFEAPPEPAAVPPEVADVQAQPPPDQATTVVVVPPPEPEPEPEPQPEPEPPAAAPVEAVTEVRLADQPEAPAAEPPSPEPAVTEPAAAEPEPVTPPQQVQTAAGSMVAPPPEEEAPTEAAEEQDTSGAPEPAAAEATTAEDEAAPEPLEVTAEVIAEVTPPAVAGDDQPAPAAAAGDEGGEDDMGDAGDADVADDAEVGEPEAPLLTAVPETAAAPEVAAAPAPVPATGRVYGAEEGNYRILVRAKTSSWIQVRDDVANRLLLTRLLRAGDSYRVPDRPGLKLLTGNAGALEILVDGETVPPIGSEGVVRRGVALDAERLRQGTAVGE